MLLDIAERGRYLGLVLFSAQQFRSQVHRRVAGNFGYSPYGRMDADELATPGYSILSLATRTRLATLEKGQLMVRHPHFTQPIFVRFPRPAVMQGRDGAERYPQSAEIDLETSVYRSLRTLDRSIRLAWVKDIVALYDETDILRARNAVMLEKPANVKSAFESKFRTIIPPQAAALANASRHATPASVRSLPLSDPYDP